MSWLSGLFGWVPTLLHWLYNLAFIALAGYLIWRYWEAVLKALKDFWQSLQDFWSSLFGGRTTETVADEEAVDMTLPPRPFADFADPFAAGTAARYSPEELLAYSFQALEAWGREHGCQRTEEQTPHEFAESVGTCQRAVGREAQTLADLYCLAAFSGKMLPRDQAERLRDLWRAMRATPAPPPVAAPAAE